jgi:hypothetical protein
VEAFNVVNRYGPFDEDAQVSIGYLGNKTAGGHGPLRWKLDIENCSTVLGIHIIHLDRAIPLYQSTGIKIPVDEQVIDTSQIKRWITDCDDDHAGHCHSLKDPWTRVDPAPELIFIDVEWQRLVRRKGSRRFVSLSYMWGKPVPGIEPFQTKLHNYDDLCQEGAFSFPENYCRLPNVVKDSITLTKRLGLRYLWCDRFSIIQDDPVSKPMYLNMMAAIYATSYLTIAACEGSDGNVGLLGISADRPRTRPFYHFNFGPGAHMMSVDPIRPLGVDCNSYHTRGWTFQEWCLAPRLLAFHHNTVSFQCRRSLRTEIGARPNVPVIPQVANLKQGEMMLSRWPNFTLYATFVEDYTALDLTYPEDAYYAFSAFVANMGRAMVGGIFFGLPEVIFSGALLWEPLSGVQRRRDRHGDVMRGFPSWSWLGWSGHVTTMPWIRMHDYFEMSGKSRLHQSAFTATIQPHLTFWKTRKRDNRREKEKIHNGYYETAQRKDIDLSYEALPPGLRLRHPVPLADEPVLNDNESWDPVIEFRTTRLSNMRIGRCQRDKNETIQEFDILTASGEMAGTMVYRRLEPIVEGNTCNLICIGKLEAEWMWTACGSIFKESAWFHRGCPEGCGEEEEACCLGEDWVYKCYNVMWVEWEDGIAYRKAIGRAFEHVWDAAGSEEVDVRLG